MGAQMEIVKDSEGNSHIIFDESTLYDDSQMGNNFSDFEILQILNNDEDNNSNNPCFVSKVRSLNNHKIYAMKKIPMNNLSNQQCQNCLAEINKLKELNNPHILRYYNSFMDNNMNFYLIMEFMNNTDILGFIKAHQVLDKDIKEEEIWNILLQCISALSYLHKQNLINCGIKFTNIFMNNEQNAKIGVYADPYSQGNQIHTFQDDIYDLGKFFYSMCFSKDPNLKNIKSIKEVNIYNMNNFNYSGELMNIIYKMVNINKQEIPSADNLYNIIKEQYVKKYAKNSSIRAVLRCLYAFPSLTQIMLKYENEYENNKDKYYINFWYLKAIKAISGIDETNLVECIYEFRRAIACENSKLDGNKEIDPIYLLAFLLQKMHKETNKKEGNTETEENQMGNYVINSIFNGEEEDKTNKEQMLYKFVTYFQSNVHSPISDLFFGFMKVKRNCATCKTGKYSFHNFCFVVFDLSNRENNSGFDLIIDGFKAEHLYAKELDPDKPERVYCERCLTYQKHHEFNRYYMMNHQLVISFIRGNEFKNDSKINFNEYLNLVDYIDEKNDSPKNYYLVGCIKMVKDQGNEKYIYYARDPYNFNIWHINDELVNSNSAPINEMKNDGKIIMLFYNNIENKPKNE